jgi:cytochrome c553
MLRRISFLILLMCLLGLSRPGAASGVDEILRAYDMKPNIRNGEKVYAKCVSCHHDKGWGKEDGSVPVIGGQYAKVLIRQMADIRSLSKEDNPDMYAQADPDLIGGAQAIADVTAYIASMAGDANTSKGRGDQLELGKNLYEAKCRQCHGDQAQGDVLDFVPKLKGQHYAYLLRRIQWIGSGNKKNSKPIMVIRTKSLSAKEMEAVADYISRM